MKYIFFIAFCSLSYLGLAQGHKNSVDNTTYRATRDSLNKVFPKNTLYFELLGNGGLASINYDRIFYQRNKLKLSYRVGFMIVPSFSVKIGRGTLSVGDGRAQTFLPVGLNLMYGKRNKFLEFGVGYTFARSFFPMYNKDKVFVGDFLSTLHIGVVSLGYRRQSKKGLFFKTGAHVLNLLNFNAPAPEGTSKWKTAPSISVAIGKSF